jgi:hypothetical protein
MPVLRMDHDDLTTPMITSELVDALEHLMKVIDKKGYDNVSEKTQEAYDTIWKFRKHTDGYNDAQSCATIYYP